jgi:hypothetical protein
VGVLASLINKVSDFVNSLGNQIPSFNMPSTNWGEYIATINACIYTANIIFPMDQVLIVLGILISFSFVMFAFYWIQRALNILRGSG